MYRVVSVAASLLAVLTLGACQQMPAQQTGQPGAMAPGALPAQFPAQAAPQAPAQAQAAPAAPGAATQLPSVDFRLAQPERAPELKELRMANTTLWFAPQPVLSRGDLNTVVAVKAKDGKHYVRFGFTQAGAQKLAAVTQRFPGKVLVLTINGNLVATPRIARPVTNGLLFVPMASEQQALNVAAVIGGAGTPTAPAAPAAPAARAPATRAPAAR
jgi:preprotein translocase subunit SecD